MKKINLLIIGILFAGLSFGQTLSTGVIAGAGGSHSESGNSITWVLGQAITGNSGNSQLSQGFMQGNIVVEELNNNETETNIDVVQDFEVNVYPNPTVEGVIVETSFENEEQIFMTITDMQGRKIYQQEIQTDKERINLSEYSSGIYFLKIQNNKQVIKTIKISKVK